MEDQQQQQQEQRQKQIYDNFWTPADTVLSSTFMTYNVNNAKAAERYAKYQWEKRADRARSVILSNKPGIVCIQELRHFFGGISVNSWLAGFSGYKYEIGYRSASAFAFAQVNLYDPSMFYAHQTLKRWLSETPSTVSDHWASDPSKATGSLVLCTRFIPVHNNEMRNNLAPFWVFNVHFPMGPEDAKTRSCVTLIEIIREVCGLYKDDAYIVAGDFNFFPDGDAELQRKLLYNAGMIDAGANAVTSQLHKPIGGTFVGYDYDEYKAADLQNLTSRLDHVFISKSLTWANQFNYSAARVITETGLDKEPEELTNRDFPSDHLPLAISFSLVPAPVSEQK